MKAELIIRERVVYPDESLAEIVVWRVPSPVPPSEHPFKYRLVYVVDGQRTLGYDNERGKGDHRHIAGKEEPITFTSLQALIRQFRDEVKDLRRSRQ